MNTINNLPARDRLLVGLALCALSLSLWCADATVTNAETAITGQWLVEFTDRADTVQLTFQRTRGDRWNWSSSFSVPVSGLRGLDRGQAGAGGSVAKNVEYTSFIAWK